MEGFRIDQDQLEYIYNRVDITQDGLISKIEMKKFLVELFLKAKEWKLDIEEESEEEN